MRFLLPLLLCGIVVIGCSDSKKPNYSRPSNFVLQKLLIEVQPVNGRNLNNKETARFKGEFQANGICAIESITLIKHKPVPSDFTNWTLNDLNSFRHQYQTLFDVDPFDREMTIFMAHLSGNYEDNKKIGGLALGHEYIVMFDNYVSNDFQSIVLMHEIGHTLGLVDSSKRAPEQINQNNPNHCITSGCVMAPSPLLLTSFDYLCNKDIQTMKVQGPNFATVCDCDGF